MAGDQRDDKHRLLARGVRIDGEDALALMAQLFEIPGQALVADDLGDGLLLQAVVGVDDPLLIQREQHDGSPENDQEDGGQQGKGTAGVVAALQLDHDGHGQAFPAAWRHEKTADGINSPEMAESVN